MSRTVVKLTRFVAVSAMAGALAVCCAVPGKTAEATRNAVTQATASPGAAALEKAAQEKKYLFIFFWKDDTQHSRVMRGVFQTAMAKLTDSAQSIEIQTADPAEQQIVARYDVSRAPMPLVLSIAPNGAITKGFPVKFDEKQLSQAFVSPGTAKCLKALQSRKLVLLSVQSRSPYVRQVSLQQGLADFVADARFAGATEVIAIDPADPAEASFLQELQVDLRAAGQTTVFLAPPGSVVGKFSGPVTKQQLVAKLQEAQSDPCAGGKCGPGGCGPKK